MVGPTKVKPRRLSSPLIAPSLGCLRRHLGPGTAAPAGADGRQRAPTAARVRGFPRSPADLQQRAGVGDGPTPPWPGSGRWTRRRVRRRPRPRRRTRRRRRGRTRRGPAGSPPACAGRSSSSAAALGGPPASGAPNSRRSSRTGNAPLAGRGSRHYERIGGRPRRSACRDAYRAGRARRRRPAGGSRDRPSPPRAGRMPLGTPGDGRPHRRSVVGPRAHLAPHNSGHGCVVCCCGRSSSWPSRSRRAVPGSPAPQAARRRPLGPRGEPPQRRAGPAARGPSRRPSAWLFVGASVTAGWYASTPDRAYPALVAGRAARRRPRRAAPRRGDARRHGRGGRGLGPRPPERAGGRPARHERLRAVGPPRGVRRPPMPGCCAACARRRRGRRSCAWAAGTIPPPPNHLGVPAAAYDAVAASACEAEQGPLRRPQRSSSSTGRTTGRPAGRRSSGPAIVSTRTTAGTTRSPAEVLQQGASDAPLSELVPLTPPAYPSGVCRRS